MNTTQLDDIENELSTLGAESASLRAKLKRLNSGESYLDLRVGRSIRRLAAHDPSAAALLTRFQTNTTNQDQTTL